MSVDILLPSGSLATKCNRQKGEGPQSASSIDILRPLIASPPNASVKKKQGWGADDHKLDMEFIVQLLAH